jgi:hypothetical protein
LESNVPKNPVLTNVWVCVYAIVCVIADVIRSNVDWYVNGYVVTVVALIHRVRGIVETNVFV